MNRKSPKTTEPTLAQIAAALKISVRRVSQLRIDGLPTDSIESALAWRSSREADDSVVALRRERIALVRSQRERTELENAKVRGEMIPRGDVAEMLVKIACAMNASFRVVEREIPQLCLGLPLAQSRPKTKERMREIQSMLADNESEFWKDHPESKSPDF